MSRSGVDLVAARRYDQGMSMLERLGLRGLRRQLVSGLSGRILEIGAGTGANVALYDGNVEVIAVDLRDAYLGAASGKAGTQVSGPEVWVACADVQALPFRAGYFDAVVGSLVFCSIASPPTALAEIARVLRPDGQLRLLEHVRGQKRLTRLATDLFHPFWFALQGECHLNRDTAVTVAEAGYRIEAESVHGQGILHLISARRPVITAGAGTAGQRP